MAPVELRTENLELVVQSPAEVLARIEAMVVDDLSPSARCGERSCLVRLEAPHG